ncbi:cytochrome P450 [Cristinia sonorae]|uniref:Cytochrome P450 n=1 Tax=Cristinia sonorae TaxID=1940300 RepID=A0A8K0XTH2_9AGAR|nr:cytochrome P450 [Cristinia sonorae]
MYTLTATVLLGLSILLFVLRRGFRPSHLPLPPGPRRAWLVGNLFNFPRTRPWLTFREWCNIHGDLFFIHLPLKPIVIIGSVKVAKELLDNRSNIYSGRPYSVMLDLINAYWSFAMMPCNSTWRTHRRHFHDYFNRSALPQYHAIELEETQKVLVRMLESPNEAPQHIRNLPGSSIIRIVYGTRTAAELQDYVDLAERGLEAARKLLVPGAFLAELIPVLRYVPPWLPGGAARKFAAQYRPAMDELRHRPFNEVKDALAKGKAVPSIASRLIEELQDEHGNITEENDHMAGSVSAVAYAAAADTTTAAAQAVMVAMAMFPDAQRKAQAELDRVVGHSRLPDFNDLDNLVYVHAVVLETLRWMPIVPLGLAHHLEADDSYEGYYIPKGTIVIPNIWAMLHNPEEYPEPETFRPERFLDNDGKPSFSVRDPTTIVFGFGRRVCAGVDFTLGMLKIFAASVLHVYDIQPGVDEDGKPVILSSEGSDEAMSSPITFPRHIKARSPQSEQLIRDIVLHEGAY